MSTPRAWGEQVSEAGVLPSRWDAKSPGSGVRWTRLGVHLAPQRLLASVSLTHEASRAGAAVRLQCLALRAAHGAGCCRRHPSGAMMQEGHPCFTVT